MTPLFRVGLENTRGEFTTKTVEIEAVDREDAGRIAEKQNPGFTPFWSETVKEPEA